MLNRRHILASALAAPAILRFGTGTAQAGTNHEKAGNEEFESALGLIADIHVNIVVLGGQSTDTMGDLLVSHLVSTETRDRERIGVVHVAQRHVTRA